MLQNKLCVESSKDSIFLFDVTGKYDAVTNTTGFGAPNKTVADIDRAVVKVIPPGVTEEDAIEIDVYPTLPNTDNIGWEILPEHLTGLGYETIVDGKWEFIYTLYDDDDVPVSEFSTRVCSLFYNHVQCCVDKMSAGLNVCDFESSENDEIIDAPILFERMVNAACCGKMDKALRIYNYLVALCECCP